MHSGKPNPKYDGSDPRTANKYLCKMTALARSALAPGMSVDGPLILEEAETTLVIPPKWQVALGALGSVVATRKD